MWRKMIKNPNYDDQNAAWIPNFQIKMSYAVACNVDNDRGLQFKVFKFR